MTEPLPPAITVRVGGWQRTFPAGRDVVVGRDVRADIRLPHPGVSRSHLTLRCRDGRWTAVDDSDNGVYVGDTRVPSVDVRGGDTVHLGGPDGPRLSFDVAAQPDSRPIGHPTIRIGRGPDNDIVVPDVLASSRHATVMHTAQGARIQQSDRHAETFVNGAPVRDAPLRDDDVVTIGNVDFVYAGGHLARRVERAGIEVRDVSLTIADGRTLLNRVSFTAAPGTLTAVIGPSGSGKSTLAHVAVGLAAPTTGSVSFENRDLHAEYASLRGRVGIVPRDDVVHRRLTIRQALDYAAALRIPPDTTEAERQQAISQVLEELGLTPHADTAIDTLSDGQRTRVGIGVELLTGPSLLVLDEPTTGLDPALDHQAMSMLRELADAGRVVIVVTRALMVLDLCDRVLVLAPGGRIAYYGAPADVAEALGSSDWADVFTDVCADPEGAQQRHFARTEWPPAQVTSTANVVAVRPARPPVGHQVVTLARRRIQLIGANRGYLVFLVALPLLIGLTPLAVAGEQTLGFMNLGASVMGMSLSVRELVGERPIFRHEQASGLSATAYLVSKILVLGAIGTLQSAILVAVVGRFGDAPLELFVVLAATCVASMVLGLLVSAIARTDNQVLLLTVAVLMAQLVFAGGIAVLVVLAVLSAALARWLIRARRPVA